MPAIDPLFNIYVLSAIFAAALFFVIYSYRKVNSQARSCGSLMAYRILVLLLLFVVALQPGIEEAEEYVQKDRLYFLTDSSESMGIRDMPGQKSRGEVLREMLNGDDAQIAELKKSYELKEYSFDSDLNKNKKDGAAGKSTALGTALFKTARDSNIHKVKGIVVFSDGVSNSGLSMNRAISELKRRKTPVYSVLMGQDSYQGEIVDGAVLEVDCPESVQSDKKLKVSSSFVLRGLKGKKARLQYLIDDKVIFQKTVESDKSEKSFRETESLTLKNLPAGYHKLGVKVLTSEKEISPPNNKREVYFLVREGGLKVLMVATSPSADFKFLKRLLQSFDDISATVPNPFLSRSPLGKKYYENLKVEDYDVIIFHNPQLKFLPQSFVARCERVMKNRRQGLMIMGEAFSRELKAKGIFKNYLPYSSLSPKAEEEEVAVKVSAGGQSHFITGFLDKISPLQRNEILKPFSGRYVKVTSLLTSKSLLNAKGTPLLLSGRNKQCRVMWVNVSGMWQWMRNDESQAVYTQLWRRMIFYLASREADLTAKLAIYSGKTRFKSAEDFSISVSLLDDEGNAVEGMEAQLTVEHLSLIHI